MRPARAGYAKGVLPGATMTRILCLIAAASALAACAPPDLPPPLPPAEGPAPALAPLAELPAASAAAAQDPGPDVLSRAEALRRRVAR